MAKIQIKIEKHTPLEDFSDNPAENGRSPLIQNGKTLILFGIKSCACHIKALFL
jgi:hypothetical protein